MSNKLTDNELNKIYSARFDKADVERSILWKTLCTYYFQAYVGADDTVLDLAAGYCEFINNIQCKQRYAIDMNPETKKRAAKGVTVKIAPSDQLPKDLTGKIDVVFVSNFFEHLDSKHALLKTLKEIRRVLKPDGKLLVLQPNINLTKHTYWDFVDHSLPLNEKSLREALEISGFDIVKQITRFLPYTASSKLPVNTWLIRLYLSLPPAQWLLGKQTFMVANPTKQ